LIRQLVEYKKFKDAAAQLQTLEIRQEEVFPRLPAKPDFVREEPAGKAQASLFDLINAVNSVLKRLNKAEDLRDIFEDKWTVSEKIEHILKLIDHARALKFSALFESATSRTEVVVTFLAMLELIRLRQIVAIQDTDFAEIEIVQASPAEQPSATLAESYANAVVQEAVVGETDSTPAPSSN